MGDFVDLPIVPAAGLTACVAGAAITSGALFYNPGHGVQPPTGENFAATAAFIAGGAACLGGMLAMQKRK